MNKKKKEKTYLFRARWNQHKYTFCAQQRTTLKWYFVNKPKKGFYQGEIEEGATHPTHVRFNGRDCNISS